MPSVVTKFLAAVSAGRNRNTQAIELKVLSFDIVQQAVMSGIKPVAARIVVFHRYRNPVAELKPLIQVCSNGDLPFRDIIDEQTSPRFQDSNAFR